MDTTSIVILTIVTLVIGYRWMMKKGNEKFWATMKDLNARHGTAFGVDHEDAATVVGTNPLWGIMAFDRKNRKIAYITKGGKSIEILDYAFIRACQLAWDETTHAGGGQIGFVAYGSSRTRHSNPVIVIETSDLRRPVVKLRMPSMAYGEDALARLNILING